MGSSRDNSTMKASIHPWMAPMAMDQATTSIDEEIPQTRCLDTILCLVYILLIGKLFVFRRVCPPYRPWGISAWPVKHMTCEGDRTEADILEGWLDFRIGLTYRNMDVFGGLVGEAVCYVYQPCGTRGERKARSKLLKWIIILYR